MNGQGCTPLAPREESEARSGLTRSVRSRQHNLRFVAQPSCEDRDDVFDLFVGEFISLWDAVPFFETAAAAGGGGVLGDENGMAAHWRLPAVVLRFGRREAVANELPAMPRITGSAFSAKYAHFLGRGGNGCGTDSWPGRRKGRQVVASHLKRKSGNPVMSRSRVCGRTQWSAES